jgi:phosphate transport system substrate-binding protein
VRNSFVLIIFTIAMLVSIAGCAKPLMESAESRSGVGIITRPNSSQPMNDGMNVFSNYEGTLNISVGTDCASIIKETAKRIMAANPKITINMISSKSGLKAFPFAVKGLAVIIYQDIQVMSITSEQLKDIFTGEITNWKDVGGDDAGISVYTHDETSSKRKAFMRFALKNTAITKSADVVTSDGVMKKSVAFDPYGIGYISIENIDNSVKVLNLDGVSPTEENAKSGMYPLARTLYLNIDGEPEELKEAFIGYVTGGDCAKLIMERGFIPLYEPVKDQHDKSN